MSTLKHFRFLDLPVELRLIVYEQLDTITIVDTMPGTTMSPDAMIIFEPISPGEDHNRYLGVANHQLHVTTMRKGFSTDILRTCRAVHHEAAPIIAKKLSQMKQESVLLRANFGTFIRIFCYESWTKEAIGFLSPLLEPCAMFLDQAIESHPIGPDRGDRPHLEITLDHVRTNDCQMLSSMAAIALFELFNLAVVHDVACTVICEGMLPAYHGTNGVVHSSRDVLDALVGGTGTLPTGRTVESYLRIEELDEEEWGQHVAKWTAEVHSCQRSSQTTWRLRLGWILPMIGIVCLGLALSSYIS